MQNRTFCIEQPAHKMNIIALFKIPPKSACELITEKFWGRVFQMLYIAYDAGYYRHKKQLQSALWKI